MLQKNIILFLMLTCFTITAKSQIVVDSTKLPENLSKHIVVAGDTIQFDSRQYAVNLDAFLQDLANKIPGLTANSNGSYNIRGEKVTEVLINGSQFFMDNDGVVLKNFPTFFVQGVNFFDDLSFQSIYSGLKDANYDRALNFITEPAYYQSIFGRAYAGYGYQGKWSAGVNANIFDGKRKLSFVGQTNNVNDMPFTSVDILGVNNTNSGSQGNNNTPPDFEDMFGNPANFSIDQSNGVNTTNSAGVSYFDQYGKWKFFGNYFFNATDNNTSGIYERDYLEVQDDHTTAYTDTSSMTSHNQNHRLKFRAYYLPDNRNFFRATLVLSAQQSRGDSYINDTYFYNDTITSQSTGKSHVDVSGLKGSLTLDYVHRFAKPNRSLVVSLVPSLNVADGYNSFNSLITINPVIAMPLSVRTDVTERESGANATVIYAEPIAKNNLLQFRYKPSYTTGLYDQRFDTVRTPLVYDTLVNQQLTNSYLLQAGGLAWQYKAANWFINAGLDLQYAEMRTNTSGMTTADIAKNYFNILPTFSFALNPSAQQNLKLNLKSSTRAPKFSDLLQTVTIINPLNVHVGNPNLDQEWHLLLNARYTALLPDGQTTLIASGSAEYVQDYIGYNTINDGSDSGNDGIPGASGVNVMRPVNLDNYFTSSLYVDYGRQLPFFYSNFDVSLQYNYTYLPSQINSVANFSKQNNGVLSMRFSNSSIAYIDFLLVANFSYTNARNSGNASRSDYLQETLMAQVNIMPWRGIIINTSFSQNFNRNLSANDDANYFLWNGYIGYKFLGPRSYEIRFTAHDILNQNRNYSYTANDTYTQTAQTNNVQRYFMLSFIYDFNFPQKTVR